MLDALKDLMQRNRFVVKIVATLLIVIAVTILIVSLGGDDEGPTLMQRGQGWYIDLTTGETFSGDPAAYPPITSPQGNPAVRIYYYQCGTDGDRFIGLYEKYTEEGKKKLTQRRSRSDDSSQVMEPEDARRMSVDGENWLSPTDPELDKLLTKKLTCSDGTRANRVVR